MLQGLGFRHWGRRGGTLKLQVLEVWVLVYFLGFRASPEGSYIVCGPLPPLAAALGTLNLNSKNLGCLARMSRHSRSAHTSGPPRIKHKRKKVKLAVLKFYKAWGFRVSALQCGFSTPTLSSRGGGWVWGSELKDLL